MNGIDFFADTNAILYFLTGNDCMKPYISAKFAYSVISEMELLSFPKLSNEEEKSICSILNKNTSLPITNEMKKETISIRRKYNIKLPDAIIAATSITTGLPLLTADVVFEKISELNLVLLKP